MVSTSRFPRRAASPSQPEVRKAALVFSAAARYISIDDADPGRHVGQHPLNRLRSAIGRPNCLRFGIGRGVFHRPARSDREAGILMRPPSRIFALARSPGPAHRSDYAGTAALSKITWRYRRASRAFDFFAVTEPPACAGPSRRPRYRRVQPPRPSPPSPRKHRRRCRCDEHLAAGNRGRPGGRSGQHRAGVRTRTGLGQAPRLSLRPAIISGR